MGSLLIILAVGLLIAAVVVLVVALRKPRRQPDWPAMRQDPLRFASQTSTFGPRQLGPGAIVGYGGVDHVVRGSVALRQGPFVWWEHLLQGNPGSRPTWLSVEEDEGQLQLVLWERRSDLQLQPGGELTVYGELFRETERGSASYTTEGTTGLPAGGDMDYIDYANAGETLFLGFERWAPTMPWEVSFGRQLTPGELTVYPAPPPTIA